MKSESRVSQDTQLTLARCGAVPMRNNVGVAFAEDGRAIRYGLMNESAKVNEELKSSDIVTIVPVLIQPHHVGRTFGLFGAFETKREGWNITPGDRRAQAQLRFINLIRRHGGVADFITEGRQIETLLGIYR